MHRVRGLDIHGKRGVGGLDMYGGGGWTCMGGGGGGHA